MAAVADRAWGAALPAEQIFSWIHQHGVLDPEQMTNLPKSLRATLADEGVGSLLAVDQVRPAEDGSSKLLCAWDDNPIETVLLPSSARSHDADAAAGFDEDDRTDELGAKHTGERGGAKVPVTQCVSTQVGAPWGASFAQVGSPVSSGTCRRPKSSDNSSRGEPHSRPNRDYETSCSWGWASRFTTSTRRSPPSN